MAGGETRVDEVALSAVSTDLTSEGSRVHDQAVRLGLAPDAGRSSDETARALGGLATTLGETITAYRASDDRSLERMDGTVAPK